MWDYSQIFNIHVTKFQNERRKKFELKKFQNI